MEIEFNVESNTIDNDINMSESSSLDYSNYITTDYETNSNNERRGLFSFHNKTNNKQKILSSTEIRLNKDIEELKKNQNIGKYVDVIFNNYKKIKDTENYQMIFEFKDHFSLKFIFTSDFPYEPPKISFFAGNEYPFLFDSYGDIKLDILKRENWSPTFWISTLIIHIEKEIYEKTNIFNKPNNVDNSIDKISFLKKGNYNKRNWNDYLNGINFEESIEYVKFCELKKNKFNDF